MSVKSVIVFHTLKFIFGNRNLETLNHGLLCKASEGFLKGLFRSGSDWNLVWFFFFFFSNNDLCSL